ncbi:hypothetical protein VFPPC_09884 [Pochonia chlamydosporia 170]|uniref:Uncharacterized protein n=1 Tax=Pochonia chlamydosporia 170 TaxID=1380566 RepID=A0A179FD52_METCM|nr:hypothetical protein VFPPC_09884 [Pochonia chlamydosporia 170]OAQ63416.1 hypothetical protein VFPPC_09884 [Pochonia chlamydosporia 170]
MDYNRAPPTSEGHVPPCHQSSLQNVNLLTEAVAIIYNYINFGNSTDELAFVLNHAQSWCERFYETPSFPRDQLTEIRREHPNIFNLRVFCRNRLDYSPNRGGPLYPARPILPHKSAYPVDEFTLYRAATTVARQQDARRQRQPHYADGYARVRPELEAKWFRDTALHEDIPGVLASIARLNLDVVGNSDTKPLTFVDEDPEDMGGSIFELLKGERNANGATIVYEMPPGIDTSVSSGSAMVLDYHISESWGDADASPWISVHHGSDVDLPVRARFVDGERAGWSHEHLQFDGLNILDDMEADSEGGTVDAGWDETQTDTEDGDDVALEKGKAKAKDERPTGLMGWCRWILCGKKKDGA